MRLLYTKQNMGEMSKWRVITVLLEYFAGEKPLRMSQSAENLTLCDITIAFWQGSCVFTSNN